DAPAKPRLFTLQLIELGERDGKAVTSCVIVPAADASSGQIEGITGLGPDDRVALECFASLGDGEVRTAEWVAAFKGKTCMSGETLNRRRKWLVDHHYIAPVQNKKGIYTLTMVGRASVMNQSRRIDDGTDQ